MGSVFGAVPRENGPRGTMRHTPCLSEGQGQDPAQQIVPAAQGQDTGVPVPGRRPLQDAHDTYAGSIPECQDDREGTAPQ